MTVMEINRDARQIVCVNSQGRFTVHKVTAKAVSSATTRRPPTWRRFSTGDVIKADLRSGQIREIVVLRHAWHEAAGMEQ